jgi:hypothetical protein
VDVLRAEFGVEGLREFLIPVPLDGELEGENEARLYRGGVIYMGEEALALLLLLLILRFEDDSRLSGVRFDGDGDGERPIRARCEGVSGMSEIVSLAVWEWIIGRKAKVRFRRRYSRIANML